MWMALQWQHGTDNPLPSPVPRLVSARSLSLSQSVAQLLAANVVNPVNIDVTVEEVNGLSDVVEELVRAGNT